MNPPPTPIMERHGYMVQDIASAVQAFHKAGTAFRVSHGSSNSTRPRHGAAQRTVDISLLSSVVSVDRQHRVCLVEPNVPMDRLVEATMAHGLVPPVVMEFPGITAGGGFSGTSGESSSFRHGFFNETVNSVEMVLGNGDVVRASREENSDLFHGAAGALGTLGIVTLLEVRLVPAKQFVKTTYQKLCSVSEAVSSIRLKTQSPSVDYVDGIVYSKSHSVIVSGELTDTKPADCPARTFSHAGDEWFYLHVQDATHHLFPGDTVTEYVPLGEYLFRYDRAGFWVGRQGYTYFKLVPFTRFFRWLLDDYSHTRTLYHALHASRISSQFVVQDLALPYDTAEAFIDWVDGNLGIWPLWLCPLKESALPSFHPVTAGEAASTLNKSSDTEKEHGRGQLTTSQPMLNIGVWGWGPPTAAEFVSKNRGLEHELARLGGRKWLYAHTFYEQAEFWKLYGQGWYQALREKYAATRLPTVYDKVGAEARAGAVGGALPGTGPATMPWLNRWPVGGVYGMIQAALSGDIQLHRQAKWRYRGTEGVSQG